MRRRFTIEMDADIDPRTHPSDIALICDQALNEIFTDVRDFDRGIGVAVNEIVPPDQYEKYMEWIGSR